jgi:phage anti-repressor protein
MQSNNENLSFPNNDNAPLIRVEQKEGRQVVSARELYEFLGYNKAVWSRWYPQNIVENPYAIENEDWVGFNIMLNGNETKDFALSIDFAKRLAMRAQTDKGEQARQYFLECEKALQKNLPTPMTTAEIVLWNAQRLVDIEKAQLEQAEELKALQESQDATAGKLHEVESKIMNRNEDYYSLAGYYNLQGKRWNLSQVQSQQTGKKLTKISKELGYSVIEVYDARHSKVNTYHLFVLQTVLGF